MVIHRWPANSPHKGPVMWKRFPFDDVIMVRWGLVWAHRFWPQHRWPFQWGYWTQRSAGGGTRTCSQLRRTQWETSGTAAEDKMEIQSRQNNVAEIIADNIFKSILLHKNCCLFNCYWIWYPKCSIKNKPSLVQILASHRTGSMSLSESILA